MSPGVGATSLTRRNAGSRSKRSRYGAPADRADRAAGFRRDVDQLIARARRRALTQIEREAAFLQHPRLEAREQRRRQRGVVERLDDDGQRLEQALVRIALRQQPKQRAD